MGKVVVGFRGVGTYVEASSQHLEGSGIVAFLSLDDGFEKESVVTLGVICLLCVAHNLRGYQNPQYEYLDFQELYFFNFLIL